MARTVEVGNLVRPERGEVDYFTEAQAATLYHGAGYTLYVPDQGWTVTADPDRRMVTWALAEREDATLSVRVWPGLGRATEEALYAAVRAETPDYPLVSEVPMTLRYVDHGEVLTVRFYQYGGDCYTITQHYPNESQVGYGSRVAAVAQTFLLFPGPAPGGHGHDESWPYRPVGTRLVVSGIRRAVQDPP